MSIDVFILNWILIDTVIIILLILFLLSVKLFKEASRWRGAFINVESVENEDFKQSDVKLKTVNVIVKKWSVIKKVLKQSNDNKPVIVFIRTNYKKSQVNLLTEGLISNGYTVVNIRIQINPCPGCDLLDGAFKKTRDTRYP